MIMRGLSCDHVEFVHFGGGQMTPLTPPGYGPDFLFFLFHFSFSQRGHSYGKYIDTTINQIYKYIYRLIHRSIHTNQDIVALHKFHKAYVKFKNY